MNENAKRLRWVCNRLFQLDEIIHDLKARGLQVPWELHKESRELEREADLLESIEDSDVWSVGR